MIEIKIQRKNDKIVHFKIRGHANSSEYGQDIVCAAISSVSQMTLNGLLEVLKFKNLKYEEKEGYIICDLENSDLTEDEREKAFILTESMYKYIEEVAKTYKKYVKLTIKEVGKWY